MNRKFLWQKGLELFGAIEHEYIHMHTADGHS